MSVIKSREGSLFRSCTVTARAFSIVCLAIAGAAGPQQLQAAPIFEPATVVAELNSSASESASWISSDGLTIVLSSNRPGTFDLFSATRSSLSSPFSTPVTSPFTTANNATFNSSNGVLSADGLELFYHEANAISTGTFSRSTRTSTAVLFPDGNFVTTVPQPASGFNRPSWLSADGSRLYYYTDLGQLKVATRTLPTTAFTPAAFDPFSTINAGGNAVYATLSADELSVIFHSTRAGGAGGADLWYATRPSLSVVFGAPTNLSSVNTAANESSAVWRGNELFFSRSATTAGSTSDIYRAVQRVAQVPEPSTAVLAGLGMLLVAGARRRRS